MDLGMTVEILTQLGLGALVTFFAILLWSYTRDSAWMLVIIGIILKFGEVMYTTFELFGIVRPGLLVIRGVAVGKVVLLALPYIAFAAAFLIMILRSRVRIRTLSESMEREETGGRRKRRKELAEGSSPEAGPPEPSTAPESVAEATAAPKSTAAPESLEATESAPKKAGEAARPAEDAAELAAREEAEARGAAVERKAQAEAFEEAESVEEAEEIEEAEPIEEAEEVPDDETHA